ncbi:ribonuclease III [Aureimonas mangrovi]|uniref:ribonuclease III n=1 Tax=Aureimonas mangrovi TaxID=2758041 RepID=UPI00163D44E5|nr:ribonuclease III [Aureimonas mangrovi]
MARLRRPELAGGLEELIGIRFADRARLERALTHSSLRRRGDGADYERLEFLGDRVLGLVVAERLFELYPGSDEGDLSVRLNTLVSAETCAEVADEIGLERFIRHGGDLKSLGGERTRNVRADVVEALIAAVYLDHGLPAARAFILRFWEVRLGQASFARRDPKTELQEWAHKRCGQPPRYEMLERTGPDHEPVFTVSASVQGVKPTQGTGRSKRIAEQEAATAMLLREGVWSAGA